MKAASAVVLQPAAPAPPTHIAEDSTIALGLVATIVVGGAGFIASWSAKLAEIKQVAKDVVELREDLHLLRTTTERLERWRQRQIGADHARRQTGPAALAETSTFMGEK